MGISFDRSFKIAGYSVAIFKSGLLGFMRTKSPGRMIDLTSVFDQRRDGAIVLEECLDRDLIRLDDGGFKMTTAGEAIARARTRAKTPVGAAHEILGKLLDRVHVLNSDPSSVRLIEEVWLYGSMLRQEDAVGDIDLAFVSRRRPEFDGYENNPHREAHLARLLALRADVPEVQGVLWSAEWWLLDRSLFGAKRHPLLAIQHDVDDLAQLGVPCQLIYDRSQGGKVVSPILPRHPTSSGRGNAIAPQQQTPELSPSELRPMDARWISGFDPRGTVSPYRIFRGWTDETHKLFPRQPNGLRIAGDDYQPDATFWAPKCLRKVQLNGRQAVCIINGNEFWGTSIVLRRRIEQTSSTLTLHAGLEALELFRRRQLVLPTVPDLAAAIALVVAVDAERMMRRAAEIHEFPEVRIAVAHDGSDALSTIAAHVLVLLDRRLIRIEPKQWGGSRAVISSLIKN